MKIIKKTMEVLCLIVLLINLNIGHFNTIEKDILRLNYSYSKENKGFGVGVVC